VENGKLHPAMRLQFNKYQGTGNDFIIIDNRLGLINLTDEQVKFLCDRKFGIGSDGLILLEKSEKLDFDMNFYNPDASRSFCGNGSRCVVRFAADLGLIGANGGFSAIDGEHEFAIDQNHIAIHMSDVTGITRENDDFVINTGSPHYLRFVNEVDGVDILPESRAIRYGDNTVFRESMSILSSQLILEFACVPMNVVLKMKH
jgi:diaminopimelate epimerase